MNRASPYRAPAPATTRGVQFTPAGAPSMPDGRLAARRAKTVGEIQIGDTSQARAHRCSATRPIATPDTGVIPTPGVFRDAIEDPSLPGAKLPW
jgi:hypothetical protein